MRVFFDTNVLVSAFAARGLCADLFRYVLVEHELVVAEIVLSELRRVLRDRFRVPRETILEIEAMLREHVVVPKPRAHLALGLSDADDEWIVASAVAAEADVLVTGDKGFAELTRPPLRILDPRGAWELFQRERPGG